MASRAPFERDDEQGATYEVEVTQGGGKHVEVYLDDQYGVVAVDEEQESEDGDQDEADDENEDGERDQGGERG